MGAELIMMRNLTTAITKGIERVFMDFLEQGPGGLPELSLEAPMVFGDVAALSPEFGWGFDLLEYLDRGGARVLRVSAGPRAALVAVDASVVKVAETAAGPIVGLKAAVVERSDSMSVGIVGPFLKLIRIPPHRWGALPSAIKDEFRLFERSVQLWVLKNTRDRIILFDGTLTVSPDRCGALMSEAVEEAGGHGNIVMAFAKETGLASALALLRSLGEPPCVLEITEAVGRFWSGLRPLGSTYAVVLSNTLFPIRAEAYPSEKALEGFSKLLSSDALRYGYPETLILAHLYAGFSWLEIVAARQALQGEARSRLADLLSPREVILSPFEREPREDPS